MSQGGSWYPDVCHIPRPEVFLNKLLEMLSVQFTQILADSSPWSLQERLTRRLVINATLLHHMRLASKWSYAGLLPGSAAGLVARFPDRTDNFPQV
jgi:hypothetical protein